ncbi:MAG: hypothetical protein WC333_09430 [Dehalococcoidia bacterium]|jgi:hypothetical protein
MKKLIAILISVLLLACLASTSYTDEIPFDERIVASYMNSPETSISENFVGSYIVP